MCCADYYFTGHFIVHKVIHMIYGVRAKGGLSLNASDL